MLIESCHKLLCMEHVAAVRITGVPHESDTLFRSSDASLQQFFFSACVANMRLRSWTAYTACCPHMSLVLEVMRALQLPPEAWLRLRGDNTGITESLGSEQASMHSMLPMVHVGACARVWSFKSSGYEALAAILYWRHLFGICGSSLLQSKCNVLAIDRQVVLRRIIIHPNGKPGRTLSRGKCGAVSLKELFQSFVSSECGNDNSVCRVLLLGGSA